MVLKTNQSFDHQDLCSSRLPELDWRARLKLIALLFQQPPQSELREICASASPYALREFVESELLYSPFSGEFIIGCMVAAQFDKLSLTMARAIDHRLDSLCRVSQDRLSVGQTQEFRWLFRFVASNATGTQGALLRFTERFPGVVLSTFDHFFSTAHNSGIEEETIYITTFPFILATLSRMSAAPALSEVGLFAIWRHQKVDQVIVPLVIRQLDDGTPHLRALAAAVLGLEWCSVVSRHFDLSSSVNMRYQAPHGDSPWRLKDIRLRLNRGSELVEMGSNGSYKISGTLSADLPKNSTSEVVIKLIQALDDPESAVRANALLSLVVYQKLGSVGVRRIKELHHNDPSAEVRDCAEAALNFRQSRRIILRGRKKDAAIETYQHLKNLYHPRPSFWHGREFKVS